MLTCSIRISFCEQLHVTSHHPLCMLCHFRAVNRPRGVWWRNKKELSIKSLQCRPSLFTSSSFHLLFLCCRTQTVKTSISFPCFFFLFFYVPSCPEAVFKSVLYVCSFSRSGVHHRMQLAQMLHELPAVTMRTRHLSARTKLKCNRHFTIIVIKQHSLMFLQKLLFYFVSFFWLFANQSLPCFNLYDSLVQFLFNFFSFAASVIGTPEGLSTNRRCRSLLFLCCWCAWSCLLLRMMMISWLEKYQALNSSSSSSPSVTTTID